MLSSAIDGTFRGIFIQGEDLAQSDPNTQHVTAALMAMDLVVVQDLFLNETAKYAHVFLPGTSFLEKNGTFTNAERRINRVRPVMPSATGKQEWEVVVEIAHAMGYDMAYADESEIMDEIAALTPTFAGVSFKKLDELGSIQWPCNEAAPDGTRTMHVDAFVRGKGHFVPTAYVATDERANRKFPLLLTTGRILSQYNVGAQTRRTQNNTWHPEDVLDIHPSDAEMRGIRDGDWVSLASRVGETTLKANLSERMPPGVVYTTFHHPVIGSQRRHDRVLRLGDQLPRVQGDRRPGHAGADDEAADHAFGAARVHARRGGRDGRGVVTPASSSRAGVRASARDDG